MTRNDQQPLSDKEMDQLLELLEKVDGRKPLGTNLFNAISLIVVQPAVEAVWLCIAKSIHQIDTSPHPSINVYLTRRSTHDTAYPGQWHCPGSIQRAGEEIEDVFLRLAKREEFDARLKRYEFVRNFNHTTEKRGHFQSMIYLCEFEKSEGGRGSWWPIDHLPSNTVLHHKEIIIPAAVGIFRSDHATELLLQNS